MISFNNQQLFYQQVSHIRKRVIELSKGQVQAKEVSQIVQSIIKLRTSVEEYICKVSKDVQKLSNKESGLQVFQKGQQGKYQNQKIILYLWQIINFIIINSIKTSKQLQPLISLLLNTSIRYQYCFSVNTIKNGLISIHNLIANTLKNQQEQNQFELVIIEWVEKILIYFFQRQQSSKKELSCLFKDEKQQRTLIQETEWIAYIFKQLFANTYYQINHTSLIQSFEAKSTTQMIGYYLLHMVGNFFQDIIDKRGTTELVSGFQCKISDIKQMYNEKDKILVQFKISKYDLKWICKSLNKKAGQYNQLTKVYLKNQLKKEEIAEKEFDQRWRKITDMIQQIIHVLNCVLFMGGYNSKLQDQIIEEILQKNKELLNYLEVSYLLYRNIEATKYKTKVNIIVQMEKEAKSKLFKIANILDINISQIDMKGMKLENILAKGQLVSLLRLLANLVHINKRAQQPFEQNVKYLHMILSLTHDSISQATMKEWAIMFIKNVAQWSEKLRQQISNIKIQMKVQ